MTLMLLFLPFGFLKPEPYFGDLLIFQLLMMMTTETAVFSSHRLILSSFYVQQTGYILCTVGEGRTDKDLPSSQQTYLFNQEHNAVHRYNTSSISSGAGRIRAPAETQLKDKSAENWDPALTADFEIIFHFQFHSFLVHLTSEIM